MHDAKGRPLKVGDLVVIPCRVKAVHAAVDFCNVDVESVATMPGNDSHMQTGAVNTQQLLRANPGDDTGFVAVVHGKITTLGEPGA